MGEAKASVKLAGRTLLQRCLDALKAAGASSLVVVGRPGGAPALRTAAPDHGFTVAINPDPGRGMLSSVDAGLRAASAANGTWAWLLPVDCPLVSPAACALLSAAVHGTEAAAAVPEHGGRRGHPALLGPEVAWAVREAVEADAGRTLAQVLAGFGERVSIVPVDDAAVADNINRPDDVLRLRARLQEEQGR